MRVVSLLPSATEILCAAGGADLLVGRSHECDVPEMVRELPALTAARTHGGDPAAIDRAVRELRQRDEGLYTIDEERLRALRPDVILTQDLCAVCSVDRRTVERLAGTMTPVPEVVSLDPHSLEDVLDDILRVGEAIGRGDVAARAVVALRESYWSAIDYTAPYTDGPEVAFLEWTDPLFCGGHWTPALITAAGGRHSLNGAGQTSHCIPVEELVASQPDRLVICPCGFDLEATRTAVTALERTHWWGSLPAVAEGRVALVDGNQMFNRPGPRLVEAFRWLVAWINDRPELTPPGFPVIYRGAVDAGGP